MPSYSKNPTAPAMLLQHGKPEYLFGSFNDLAQTTKMFVSNAALTTNVATLTVTVVEGNIPAVGSKITVQGCPTSSGAFNVSDVALTGVTIDAVSGQGTVTFALTHANVASSTSSGVCTVRTPEVGEALANGASIPVCAQSQSGLNNTGRDLVAVVSFPSVPTAATVKLQEAAVNQDSEFTDINTVASVSGGVVTAAPLIVAANPNMFYRLNASGVSGGTNPSVIGKLLG